MTCRCVHLPASAGILTDCFELFRQKIHCWATTRTLRHCTLLSQSDAWSAIQFTEPSRRRASSSRQ